MVHKKSTQGKWFASFHDYFQYIVFARSKRMYGYLMLLVLLHIRVDTASHLKVPVW